MVQTPWGDSGTLRERQLPSVSISTFYGHFGDKEEAMLAAVDRGSALMLAATLPAYRRAGDWPSGVRFAFEAMFAFAAADPVYAQLGAVGVYGAVYALV